jgi:hypothetical protein
VTSDFDYEEANRTLPYAETKRRQSLVILGETYKLLNFDFEKGR